MRRVNCRAQILPGRVAGHGAVGPKHEVLGRGGQRAGGMGTGGGGFAVGKFVSDAVQLNTQYRNTVSAVTVPITFAVYASMAGGGSGLVAVRP